MQKKFTLFFAGLLSVFLARAYTPIVISSGFNVDVVANGTGAASTKTTAPIDNDANQYAFMTLGYNNGTTTSTLGLPTSGTINSASTSGLTFQMADYDLNNALQFTSQGNSGTLTFATPTAAAEVFLLGVAGNGPDTVDVTVNFATGSPQTFTGVIINDWYNATPFAINALGRVSRTTNNIDVSNATNPRMYESKLVLSAANYSNPIVSLTITKADALGRTNIMAVATNPQCQTPADQATSLVLLPTTSQITGSFTAAVSNPTSYLVVRYPGGATPVAPVDGTTYTPGGSLGTGTIVSVGAATNFLSQGLFAGTTYDYYVYSFNTFCANGPTYNTTAPLFGSIMTTACGGPANVVIPVGPFETYTSITSAMASIGTTGISGPVVLELQSNYTSTAETFPITFPYNPCVGTTNTLTIRPATGAIGLVITDGSAAPTIDLNGASNIIIDGRPGGTGGMSTTDNLQIINTNTGGVAIRMYNDALNNTITYCNVQGINNSISTSGLSGVVYIGAAGANGLGNDNNTISFCDIHGTSPTTTPNIGIAAYGSTTTNGAYNDNCSILNNNIYDWYSSTANTFGVKIDQGNSAWTISNNSLYQTVARTYGANSVRPFHINSNGTGSSTMTPQGSGFTISGNYIGGNTTALGGTMILSGTAATTGVTFTGMDISVGVGAPTVVQGNIISNISFSTGTGSTTSSHFVGIYQNYGNLNITSNTVGDILNNGAITVTRTGTSTTVGSVSGIRIANGITTNVTNNTVAGITTAGTSSIGLSLNGIYIAGGTSTTISGNTIGSATLSNSLWASAATSVAQVVNGIIATGGTNTISGNFIYNITNDGTGTGAQIFGINVTGGTTSITVSGNTIYKLTTASANTGSNASSAVVGISDNASSLLLTISGNQIYDLKATSASAAVGLIGLYVNGSSNTANLVNRNFIARLSTPSTSATASVSGIVVNAGTTTYANNMISLGFDDQNTSIPNSILIRGISKSGTAANNFYHNTAYVGGIVTGTGAARTFAFQRANTSGADVIQNNIFENERSNAGGTGTNYAISFGSNSGTGGNTAGVTLSNNIYYANGVGSVMGYTTTDVPVYTPGWIAGDLTSISSDPYLVNPSAAGGGGGMPDLHVSTAAATPAESGGVLIASVTDDYDGDIRANNTPTDIGADAGQFIAWPTCTTPNTPTGLILTGTSNSQIDGSYTASAGGASGYIVVRYSTGATPTAPVNGTSYVAGSGLGTGTVVSVGAGTTFSDPGLLPGTTYTYYLYAFNNTNCISGPMYSTTVTGSQTTQVCSGLSGVVTVGPTGTFTTLGAALNSLSTGIGGSVILELQSTYTSAGETFPITINSNVCYNATRNLTIRPEASANGLIITSSNAGPTIDISGARYVTIDGTPGGSTGSSLLTPTAAGFTNSTNLNIINTSATGTAIRMDNQTSLCTIKYCDLQGENTTAATNPTGLAGVVYVGNTGAEGNDSLLIDHCNIHSTGANTPTLGVYALGAANTGLNTNFNDNGTISNNNIYDYFSASANSVGVELNQGVNGWTITGNSFFQTATRTWTSGSLYNRAIWLIPNRTSGSSVGNGFIVTNNFIGGSAPACGSGPYTLSALSNYFEAIRLETADGATANPTSVQGNLITNISITVTQTGDAFHAIWSSGSGSLNIGTVTGNTVGSSTSSGGAATGGITIAAGSGSPNHMIIMTPPTSSSPVINIKNNSVGNVLLTNTGNNFSGIFVNNSPTVVIDNNLIGSLTVANSISTSGTAATSAWVRGITVPGGTNNVTITNNTVANLNSNSTSTTSGTQAAGITVASTTAVIPAITGNTIFNLSASTGSTAGGVNAALLGIGTALTSSAAPTNISNNVIHSLTANTASSTAGIYMEGIFMAENSTGSTASTISKNFVHSFTVATAGNTGANLRGIENNSGPANITNNMVRLGIMADGTALPNSVKIDGLLKGSGQNNNIYFNSVYVGGTATGTSNNNTAAFRKETTNGTDDIRDNIFSNLRTNATTGGKHFAINAQSATGNSYDYNLYQYTTDFASTNSGTSTTDAAYTIGWNTGDDHSQLGGPAYIDATGPAATVNLHISPTLQSSAEHTGIAIAGVTDDIDGDVRANYTPTDIGADAGNFVANPLVVKLVKFYGERTGVVNRLGWKTLSEDHGDAFELERSTDGKEFKLLGKVNAKGEAAEYTYIDQMPVGDVNYYRLKLLETNGRFVYSNVVTIRSTKDVDRTITAYPNPAKDQVTVRVSGSNTNATLSLTDVTGKLIRTVKLDNNYAAFDLHGLAQGVYLIKYTNGSRSEVIKISKQ